MTDSLPFWLKVAFVTAQILVILFGCAGIAWGVYLMRKYGISGSPWKYRKLPRARKE